MIFQTYYNPLLWSSTEHSSTVAFYLDWEESPFSVYITGKDNYRGFNTRFHAFPVFPITPTATITLHIADDMITLQFKKGDSINLSYYVPSAYTSVFMGWHKLEDLSDEVITQIESIQDDMILYANTGNTPDNP